MANIKKIIGLVVLVLGGPVAVAGILIQLGGLLEQLNQTQIKLEKTVQKIAVFSEQQNEEREKIYQHLRDLNRNIQESRGEFELYRNSSDEKVKIFWERDWPIVKDKLEDHETRIRKLEEKRHYE